MESKKDRILIDGIRVNNREIEYSVVKGLTAAGYEVEVVPETKKNVTNVMKGSTIFVYRRAEL